MTAFSLTRQKVDDAFGYLMFLASEDFHGRFPGREEMGSFVCGCLQESKNCLLDFDGNTQIEFAAWLRQRLAQKLCDLYRRPFKKRTDIAENKAKDKVMHDRLDDISVRMQTLLENELELRPNDGTFITQVSAIGTVISEMDSLRREVFLQHYFRDRSVEKIAFERRISQGEVQRILSRAILALEKRVDEAASSESPM